MQDIIFLFIYLLFFCFAFFSLSNSCNFRRYIYYFLLLLIIIVLFIRDPYSSNDSRDYKLMYDNSLTFVSAMSIYHHNYFFSFIMYISNVIGLSFKYYIIFQASIFILLFTKSIEYIFDSYINRVIAISCLFVSSTFVFTMFNILRQGLAFYLLLFSVALILKGNNKRSFFVYLLACLSHYSTFVFFPIYIVYIIFYDRMKGKEKIILFLIPFVFFGFIKFGYLFLSIPVLGDKLSALNGEEYSNTIVYFKFILLYVLAVIFFPFRNYNYNYKRFYLFYLLMLLITALFSFNLLFFSRLIYFSSGFSVIIISFLYVSNISRGIYHKVMIYFTIILYGFFTYTYPSVVKQFGINILNIFT